MTQDHSTILTQRIGGTIFKVNIFTKPDSAETIEDKILRLIQREGLASPPDCGMIEVAQINRQSERSA